jgi:N-acetyltransferase 10
LGLQHKSVEDLEKELQLPSNQVLAMFNKIVKKIISLLEDISVNQMNKLLFSNGTEKIDKKMEPLKQSLEEELNEASKKVKKDEAQKKKELMSSFDLKQYEIKGTENEWSDALKLPATTSYVTVKRYLLLFFFK